jgi:hypothetical protein
MVIGGKMTFKSFLEEEFKELKGYKGEYVFLDREYMFDEYAPSFVLRNTIEEAYRLEKEHCKNGMVLFQIIKNPRILKKLENIVLTYEERENEMRELLEIEEELFAQEHQDFLKDRR